MRGIKVELEGRVIELSDATAAERSRLIDEFLASRESPVGSQPQEPPAGQS
ncbi:hypothetical protein ACF06I_27655 [Streptomyces albidoflavus]